MPLEECLGKLIADKFAAAGLGKAAADTGARLLVEPNRSAALGGNRQQDFRNLVLLRLGELAELGDGLIEKSGHRSTLGFGEIS